MLDKTVNRALTLEEIPVSQLTGVGPALAQKLARLEIHSCADLLFHLPLRYEDRTHITAIAALQSRHTAQIEVEISGAEIQFGRRRSLVAYASDDSGDIVLRFFYFNKGQQERLRVGGRARLFGEVRYGRSGLEMVHPEIRWLSANDDAPLHNRLTPVYPITEGLNQISLRKLIAQVLQKLPQALLPDLLPMGHRAIAALPDLKTALSLLHAPPADVDTHALLNGEHPALQRLVVEELTATQLCFMQARKQARQYRAEPIAAESPLKTAFLQQLPFQLTAAQQRVVHEIAEDMTQTQAMLRLVQGDVGSGKTVVAALAAVTAVAAGKQVALMAPTELLAEQHFDNFMRWLSPLGINSVFLAGKTKGKTRAHALAMIGDGRAAVVIGTHALFQEDVQFSDLALVIIDEQHRFGVHQRLQLWEKGRQHTMPHQLVMTATPIPRTLAMTAYADLDNSIIDELPPGRTPVTTVALPNTRRDEVIERVRAAITQGRQVYWVCTLIDESEQLQAQAAQAAFDLLQQQLQHARVAIVHGRLKAEQKQQLMSAFKRGDVDVLVATTVIEVGVDVPNASLMIIENAERLGLAQLHQLRGRVGRGSAQSHCVLMFQSPLSTFAKERLAVMRESNDGFVIAEKDLALRGPGELLGTRQTGVMAFRITDLARDQRLVPVAQQLAQRLLLDAAEQQSAALLRRWVNVRAHYVQV